MGAISISRLKTNLGVETTGSKSNGRSLIAKQERVKERSKRTINILKSSMTKILVDEGITRFCARRIERDSPARRFVMVESTIQRVSANKFLPC